MSASVCVFTSVCDPDARWFDQYLAETARLRLPFVAHFDRCSDDTVRKFKSAPNFAGGTGQPDPAKEFDERHKQAPLDRVRQLGFDWAMAWDLDETFCPAAPGEIEAAVGALREVDYADTFWVNLWEDPDHLRVDGPFCRKPRTKFYNLTTGDWKFTSAVINGPYLFRKGAPVRATKGMQLDLTCVHWGMMTRELREEHKARWDRIYGTATGTGRNVYKFWDYALDETAHPPVVVPNPYRRA